MSEKFSLNYVDTLKDEIKEDNFSFHDLEYSIKNQYLKYQNIEWAETLFLSQLEESQELKKSLENKVHNESREWLDKEILIQEAKTIVYRQLWINENQEKNWKIENFLKGIVDVLVIDNYDLAIEILETKWKILWDALLWLMSLEWIKKIAESLGENIWNLFEWDAYDKWKSVAELWLIWSWVWLWVVVWKKGLKFWMREIRLNANKESIVKSSEIKWVIKETWRKVDEIMPKKQEIKTTELLKKVDIERQIKWLEELWIPENFSRNMLESWMMNEKFLWGDLLRRFENLHKKWIDYNKMIEEAIKQTPGLTRKEALLIFSYTDNTIYKKLNAFMRWGKEILDTLTPQNIEAAKKIIWQMEEALGKMPNLKPWENWFILRWDNSKYWNWKIWDTIELDSFTSVSNNRRDIFLWKKYNTDTQISIIWKKWRVKDISILSISVNFWVSKKELKTLIDFSGKLEKLDKTNNEWVILPNSRVIITDKFKLDDLNYINAKQIK